MASSLLKELMIMAITQELTVNRESNLMEVTSVDEARNILLAHNETYLANALTAKELQKNYRDIDIILQLGIGFMKGKNFEAAQTCFSEVITLGRPFEGHYYMGKVCECLDELERARDAYLDALLISTLDMNLLYEAYKNVGNLYLKQRHLDSAEDFYHKAYAVFPESPQLIVNMGTLEMQRSDPTKAVDRFRQALQINPKFGPAWVGLSLSYQVFGDLEMAWASILKSIECDPNNSTALLLMAQWSSKNKAIDLALNHLMNYFDQGEFDHHLSLAFVELCIQSSNFSLARLELERALLWDPRQADLLSFDKALADHGY
jgi:tetratricopeptide (TPR) repeat protein